MGYQSKEQHAKYHRTRWLKTQQYIRDAKSKPCADCGVLYGYWVMDFDHRDQTQKLLTVSQTARTRSFRKVKEEIAKCDVVCANCHRERTYRSKAWLS